ncbi:conserved hypothetical protein [Paraburkholderia piptadeniae]|uniref:LysR substrate-binding domain-containing protein n=1 Tax=Paraburkholderia piptadeniae TaxID=1701573 RepID=A0A1N7SE75_9BURK|nr:conserved hypothetical protein [Paraburkholderia piptadeniae]
MFLRTGRGLTLSELGHRIHTHVKQVFEDVEALSREVASLKGVASGEVCIAALPSLFSSVVIPLFTHLQEAHPGIRLKVLESSAGQIDRWLINGNIDIGLTYRYGENRQRNSDGDRLARVGSFLVGLPNDPRLKSSTIRFADLDGLPLVLPSSPSEVRDLYDHLTRQAGILLNVAMEADSAQIQKAAAMQGSAYTILPLHSVAQELKQGLLQATRIVEPQINRDISLVATSARPVSHATREVIRCIRTTFDSSLALELTL